MSSEQSLSEAVKQRGFAYCPVFRGHIVSLKLWNAHQERDSNGEIVPGSPLDWYYCGKCKEYHSKGELEEDSER